MYLSRRDGLKTELGIYHEQAVLEPTFTELLDAIEVLRPGLMLQHREIEPDDLCVPAFVYQFPCHAVYRVCTFIDCRLQKSFSDI